MFFRTMLRSVWGEIEDYLRVIAISCFLLPWVCLATWYYAVVQGCVFYETRAPLGSFFTKPRSNLGAGTPRYLDLWNASNAHPSNTLSQYTETILISHLTMYDARKALQQQALTLKVITLEIISIDDLSSSLDQVIDIVLNLTPRVTAFSLGFCQGKDIMTHALRIFVESYAMIATLSHFQDLTVPSFFLFPGLHLMRLISQHPLSPWLTRAKLYSFQVRAEIEFRKDQSRYELKAALDLIDASYSASQLFQNSSSQSRCLEEAIDKVAIHQQMVGEMIDQSNSSLWHRIRGSEEIAKLKRYHELGERVRGRLLVVRRTMDEYEVYCSRLRSHLDFFRQTIESIPLVRLSARSSSAGPEPLLAHVRKISLLSPGQSSSVEEDGDSRDFTRITTVFRVFLYDSDSISDTGFSSLRSEVAQLCKAGTGIMMGSDDLYSICVIYDLIATTPALEDDPLSCFQTSWFVAREEAIHRWQEERGLDLNSVLSLFVKYYRDYKHGIPLPEFF